MANPRLPPGLNPRDKRPGDRRTLMRPGRPGGKPGAFKVALEERADILPLVIAGTREAIPKHSWRVEKRSILFLKVLDPVPAKDFQNQTLDELRVKIRSQIVEEFQKLRRGN